MTEFNWFEQPGAARMTPLVPPQPNSGAEALDDGLDLPPTYATLPSDELADQGANPEDPRSAAVSAEGLAPWERQMVVTPGEAPVEGASLFTVSDGEARQRGKNVERFLGRTSLGGLRPFARIGERLSGAKKRAANILAKASIAAFFALPAAEYIGSDVGSVEITKLVNNVVTPNEIFSLAIVAGGIVLQSFISGIATANYRPLREAGECLDAYMDPGANEEVTRVRWLVSGAVKIPGKIYSTIGKPLKRVGMKLSGEPPEAPEHPEEPEQSELLEQPERSELLEQPEQLEAPEESERSGFAKSLGNLIKEIGEVNLLGTSGLILKRAVDVKGNPETPSPWLVAKVSALMGASWFTLANIAEGPFRTIPFLHRPGAYVGQAYDILTNVNIMHPSVETIPGSVVVLGASAVLAAFGWDLAKFQQNNKVSNKGQLETAA